MSSAWDMHSAWDEPIGLARLKGLGDIPPNVPLPEALIKDIEDQDLDLVDCIRKHAVEVLDIDKLESRMVLWKDFSRDLEVAPTWMTLEGTPNLRQWQRILVEVMSIDAGGTQAFVRLAESGHLGYQEACRV
eukprot:2653667-Heterocapsa_arctica.AAC.1